MKKSLWIALILMLVCIFSFSACNQGDTPPANDDTSSACEHIFSEWNITKQATCKDEGEQVRVCTKCSTEEKTAIAKTDTHTEVVDAAVSASCEETGLTEGKHCSQCNEVIVAQTTTDKLGHKDDNKDHVCDNNCGKDDVGIHADSNTDKDHVCDYGCGVVLESCVDAVNDGNHNCDICSKADISTHSYGSASCDVPATCSECGETTGTALGHIDENKDHICDRECGKEDMGTHEDTDYNHKCDYGCNETIGEHSDSTTDNDHVCDYGCGVVLESCIDATGDGDHNCDICDKVDASEHTANTPTCETPSTCTECGVITSDALGHIEVVDPAVAPTCTENGLTEGKHCSRCGKTIIQQQMVEKSGHTPTESQHFPLSQICSICNNAISVELDLSLGSISINTIDGKTIYSQNGNSISFNGQALIQQSTSSTENTITIKSTTCTLNIANLNIYTSSSAPININNSTVTLNLIGTNTVKNNGDSYSNGYPGIVVSKEASLTLCGNGTITANGGYYSAGIGGRYQTATGTIIIKSGTITANGGYMGAGIGSGCSSTVNAISIFGGTVYANGNFGGAGIGGGCRSNANKESTGNSGNISITGGTVYAKGGDGSYAKIGGAGIGGGHFGNGENITIIGGYVVATGATQSAGIGGGSGGQISVACGFAGTIIISNCEITASGGTAGIGSGSNGGGKGSVCISDAKVSTTYIGTVESITITNSNVITSNATPYIEKIFNLSIEEEFCAIRGNQATIKCEATSHSGLTYQWQIYINNVWTDIEGETKSALNVIISEENLNMMYRCSVTNSWGNQKYTNSSTALELLITQQPTDVTANVGDFVSLQVECSSKNVTYQWQKSVDGGITWVDENNKNSNVYGTTISSTVTTTQYRCLVIANNGDAIYSEVATIMVVS